VVGKLAPSDRSSRPIRMLGLLRSGLLSNRDSPTSPGSGLRSGYLNRVRVTFLRLNPGRDAGIKPSRVSPRTRGHVDGKHLNPRKRVAATARTNRNSDVRHPRHRYSLNQVVVNHGRHPLLWLVLLLPPSPRVRGLTRDGMKLVPCAPSQSGASREVFDAGRDEKGSLPRGVSL
jgi:hypothetical protein